MIAAIQTKDKYRHHRLPSHLFFLLLLKLASNLAVSSAACPGPPDCFICSASQAVCKLCPDDQDIPETITDLKLIAGGCRTLESVGLLRSTSFSRYPNLERLTLNHVHVMRFFGAVFNANSKLRILSMAQNQIRSFGSSVFKGQSKLEELNMAQSQIRTLIPASFKELTGLKDLNLAGNNLTVLSEHDFDGLGNLESLHLSSNPINTIDTKVFKALSRIQTIDLGKCQMTTIPDELFGNLASLKAIDLSGNKITTVSQRSFAGTALTSLNLAKNQLTAIPSSAIRQTMAAPKAIDLSTNRISQITSNDFVGVNLDSLDLHDNPIATIDAGAFSNSNIKSLDLRGSRLTFLPKSLQTTLNRGHTVLNLEGLSAWRCDCSILWLGHYLLASTTSKSPTCGGSPSKWSGRLFTAIMPTLEAECRTTTTSTTTTTTTTTTSSTTATTTKPTTTTTEMPTTKRITKASGKLLPKVTTSKVNPVTSVTRKAITTQRPRPGGRAQTTMSGSFGHSTSNNHSNKNTGNESDESTDDTVKSIFVALIILCVLAFCLTTVGIITACFVCKRQGVVYSVTDHNVTPTPTPKTIGWKGRMEAIHTF